MFQIRRANDRGHADHGWLNTSHTFSFGEYHDPKQMGFRSLRVINEDRVAAGEGFGMHSHHNMEIISYVLAGALEHKDSLGNGEILRPGEFQRMSAGTGVRHSEFNPSPTEPVHFYQVWIVPNTLGVPPSYEQKFFADSEKRGRLRLVASPNGADGSLTIHQDANVFLTMLDPGELVEYAIPTGRHVWLQVLRGAVRVQDHQLQTSDGLAIRDEPHLCIVGELPAEVMIFDLA